MNKKHIALIAGGVISLIATIGLAKYGYLVSPAEREIINTTIQTLILGW